MRERIHPIMDIHLTDKNLTKLKKGYVVFKHVKGKRYCLRPSNMDCKTLRKIQKLKDEIKALKSRRNK